MVSTCCRCDPNSATTAAVGKIDNKSADARAKEQKIQNKNSFLRRRWLGRRSYLFVRYSAVGQEAADSVLSLRRCRN